MFWVKLTKEKAVYNQTKTIEAFNFRNKTIC